MKFCAMSFHNWRTIGLIFMTCMLKIFVRLLRMLYTVYKETQNVYGYLQQILWQREIERPNSTYANIYLNRVTKIVVHDSSKSCMFLMALRRHIVWSSDKINLHFAQHRYEAPDIVDFNTKKRKVSDQFHTESDLPQRKCPQFPKVTRRAISSVESLLMILHTSVTRFVSLQQYYIGNYTLSEA